MNRKLRRASEAHSRRTGDGTIDRCDPLISAALAHHQAGRLADAETLYRDILALDPDHADALHLLGVLASQVGQHEVAIDLIARAIARDRKNARYHANHGLALASLSRPDEALQSFDRALSLRRDDAEVHYSRGNALLALRRAPEAVAAYERALQIKPDHLNALCNRGVALAGLGRQAEAVASYDRLLAIRADHAEALSNRGSALQAMGRAADALVSFDRALALRPDDVTALFNRAFTLHALRRFEAALADYERALALHPDHPAALLNRGDVLHRLGRLDEALASYDRAIAARQGYAEAFSNRGNVLRALGRFGDALASYDAALAHRPDYSEALSNRAVALLALGRADEALASCDRALALRPDAPDALNNRASILQELGRFDEARASYDHLVGIAPDHVEAQLNRAMLLLLSGDLRRGFEAYEWRRRLPGWTARSFPQPEWSGEDVAGRRLLLYAEQGFGDTIQFIRYAALAAAQGAEVVIEVQPPLEPLLAGVFGLEVIAAGCGAMPAFDLHCPLLSLPRLFGTELATIPAATPYIAPPADRIATWDARLPAGGVRVGLVWSGHRDNPRDHERSIPFGELSPLLATGGTCFVSLQKDVRESDAEALRACRELIDIGAELRDFADTAAVIAQLDLVIAVDTAVAHLAGAMGKPVWVLLPRVPDFRWLLARSTSPWYPSARLFRQGAARTWRDVVAHVADELAVFSTRAEARS